MHGWGSRESKTSGLDLGRRITIGCVSLLVGSVRAPTCYDFVMATLAQVARNKGGTEMRTSMHIRGLSASLIAGLIVFGVSAAAEELAPKSPHHRATIHPSIVNLEPGAEQAFKVVLVATRLMAAAAPKQVTWTVNDIPGGNDTLGTIRSSGIFLHWHNPAGRPQRLTHKTTSCQPHPHAGRAFRSNNDPKGGSFLCPTGRFGCGSQPPSGQCSSLSGQA